MEFKSKYIENYLFLLIIYLLVHEGQTDGMVCNDFSDRTTW